ncbi:MAG: hypothetical protein N4A65_05610 [Cohaesibacter sp.]|jgi:hypothetical protein|nr:hypothetical protein [Cohaesibacter sp.]
MKLISDRWTRMGLGGVACLLFTMLAFPALSACLTNQSGKTVYVSLMSNRDGGQKVGNLTIGNSFCLPVSKGNAAVAKVTPYAGARIGCKVKIVGKETLVLTKFGTMNNCTFVPGDSN